MILVLNSADFSANNIGKINLPKDLTPRQKEMLAKYSKVLTNEQKLGFGVFMNAIESVMPKLKGLYLPILAENTGECFVNLASDNLSVDVIPITDAFAMENGGIKNNQTESGVKAKLGDFEGRDIYVSDMHFLFFQNYDGSIAGGTHPYVTDSRITAATVVQYVPIHDRFYTQNFKFTNLDMGADANSSVIGKGMYGFSVKSDIVTTLCDDKISTYPVNSESVEPSKTAKLQTFILNGVTQTFLSKPMQYFSYGSGITADEYTTIQTAFNEFYKLFL